MNDALKILRVLERIATTARDLAQYRALVAEAATRGDLDVSVDNYKSVASRVEDFLDGEG